MAKAGTTQRGGTSVPDHYQAVMDRFVAALEAGTMRTQRRVSLNFAHITGP